MHIPTDQLFKNLAIFKYYDIYLTQLSLFMYSYQKRTLSLKFYLTINEWGWVSYEELRKSRRVLSDNNLLDLHNSLYDTKAEFNNCFIIHSK